MATAEKLQKILAETLSPHPEILKNAEAQLTQAQRAPGHSLIVLNLVAATNNAAIDPAVRQAAAVHFKNTVKKAWDPEDDLLIAENDILTIKQHIIQLMCTVPPQIQALLSESISLIANVDYYEKWLNLLPDLVQQMDSTDLNVVVGILKTANSIFKRFRFVQRSDELYKIIIYTLNGIQEPLLKIFKKLGQEVQTSSNDVNALKPRMEALRLICRIFYSLNYQDLPEYFEDHMGEWMTDFAAYLQYQNPLLVDADEEDEPGPIDKLQAAIIENLGLYAHKDEESFMEYLPNFTSLVWNLLMSTTNYPKHDDLATRSISFLKSLVEKPMHKHLFQDESTLRQIILKIVIPNLTMRASDEERFEDDPREYMMTEVEGSSSESRRRCSQDLLRAMCRLFETETTAICSEHIGSMLNEYSSDPNNKWKAKDAAIHLMMAIAVKTQTQQTGVSQITPGVNVLDFFQIHILPELQNRSHRPVVKATAIKYVSVFRRQFSRENLVHLLPLLISHLSSTVIVVHTYAAYAIERILVTRDQVGGRNIPKIGSTELQAVIEPLFNGLFAIIELQQNENDYAMKCIMRSLDTAGETIIPVTPVVITKLTDALGRVARNPRNPQYNHYLFESIAVLVRSVCSKNPSETSKLEPLLFEPFNTILHLNVIEFTPYVFQVLAQLLEYRPAGSGLGNAFESLFPPLLTPSLWVKGNVIALSRLMQAYILKAAPELVQYLNPVLGVFQKLHASKATEASSFEILNSAIAHFPQEEMATRLPQILQLIMTRLQQDQSTKYTALVTTFFAVFVGKYGAHVFLEHMNAMQSNLAIMLLGKIWAPRLRMNAPSQRTEAKIQVIGVTKLLCETPALVTDGREVWAELLVGTVQLLSSKTFQTNTEIPEDDGVIEVGYDAVYSRLAYAKKEPEDPFPDITTPREFFVRSMHAFLTSQPQVLAVANQKLSSEDPTLAAELDGMFKQAGLRLG